MPPPESTGVPTRSLRGGGRAGRMNDGLNDWDLALDLHSTGTRHGGDVSGFTEDLE